MSEKNFNSVNIALGNVDIIREITGYLSFYAKLKLCTVSKLLCRTLTLESYSAVSQYLKCGSDIEQIIKSESVELLGEVLACCYQITESVFINILNIAYSLDKFTVIKWLFNRYKTSTWTKRILLGIMLPNMLTTSDKLGVESAVDNILTALISSAELDKLSEFIGIVKMWVPENRYALYYKCISNYVLEYGSIQVCKWWIMAYEIADSNSGDKIIIPCDLESFNAYLKHFVTTGTCAINNIVPRNPELFRLCLGYFSTEMRNEIIDRSLIQCLADTSIFQKFSHVLLQGLQEIGISSYYENSEKNRKIYIDTFLAKIGDITLVMPGFLTEYNSSDYKGLIYSALSCGNIEYATVILDNVQIEWTEGETNDIFLFYGLRSLKLFLFITSRFNVDIALCIDKNTVYKTDLSVLQYLVETMGFKSTIAVEYVDTGIDQDVLNYILVQEMAENTTMDLLAETVLAKRMDNLMLLEKLLPHISGDQLYQDFRLQIAAVQSNSIDMLQYVFKKAGNILPEHRIPLIRTAYINSSPVLLAKIMCMLDCTDMELQKLVMGITESYNPETDKIAITYFNDSSYEIQLSKQYYEQNNFNILDYICDSDNPVEDNEPYSDGDQESDMEDEPLSGSDVEYNSDFQSSESDSDSDMDIDDNMDVDEINHLGPVHQEKWEINMY